MRLMKSAGLAALMVLALGWGWPSRRRRSRRRRGRIRRAIRRRRRASRGCSPRSRPARRGSSKPAEPPASGTSGTGAAGAGGTDAGARTSATSTRSCRGRRTCSRERLLLRPGQPARSVQVAAGGAGREPEFRGPRPEGVPGLLIDEIDLTGIFHTSKGFVAQVVASNQKKSYLLKEGDQLYDGDVVSINKNEVVFKQVVQDPTALKPFREVVKSLNPAPVEPRVRRIFRGGAGDGKGISGP